MRFYAYGGVRVEQSVRAYQVEHSPYDLSDEQLGEIMDEFGGRIMPNVMGAIADMIPRGS